MHKIGARNVSQLDGLDVLLPLNLGISCSNSLFPKFKELTFSTTYIYMTAPDGLLLTLQYPKMKHVKHVIFAKPLKCCFP